MSENKKKYAYWMYPTMISEIEEMMKDANATSKSDFVCQAVNFYIGYLRQQKNINYLAPILSNVIKEQVESIEKNMCEMLFKVAVEQSINSQIIASSRKIPENVISELRHNCAREIAMTNGLITFETATEWQHGD